MEAQLQKWGNSIGLRIPSNILKDLDLKDKDKVTLVQKDNGVILTKSDHKTFEERIEGFDGSLVCCEAWEEYDVVGKEVW